MADANFRRRGMDSPDLPVDTASGPPNGNERPAKEHGQP